MAIIIRLMSINSSKVNGELCLLAGINDITKGIDIFHQKKIHKFQKWENIEFEK